MSLLKEINDSLITEGRVNIELLMTIDQILKDGKISNGVQIVALSKLIQVLKDGRIYNISNFNEVEMPVTVVDTIKKLNNEEVVLLAKRLKELLVQKNANYNETLPLPQPEFDIVTYIRQILHAQD